MTDITELAQKPTRYGTNSQGVFTNQTDGAYVSYLDFVALVEALEKAQQRIGKLEKKLTDHKRMNQEMAKAMLTPNDSDAAGMEIAALRQRIAELEHEQEHLRPVGVMSEQAFHRLENSECRFIALWPRPGIFLPRKRPEDGVLVYARTAAAAGIKVEAE